MINAKKNKQPITAPITAPITMLVGMSHLLSKGSSIVHYGLKFLKGGGIA